MSNGYFTEWKLKTVSPPSRPEKEFAKEEKVIIAVNAELKNLMSMTGSVPEYIVKLRNYLPVLEEALKAVNGLNHLYSPDRVNLLLNKLDDRTLHE